MAGLFPIKPLLSACAAAAMISVPGFAAADEASSAATLRGHAKTYLSLYSVDSAAASAAGVPRSFVDEAVDIRVMAAKDFGHLTLETQVQFDTLSTRFQALRRGGSAQPVSIAAPGLPSDDLRLVDMTFDPDDRGSVTSALHVDRLSAAGGHPGAAFVVGRQAISWGNGLIFSALDLVAPFTPTAIDREYKPGDDGVFGRLAVGESSDIEAFAVIRRDLEDGGVGTDSSLFAAKGRSRFAVGEHSLSVEAAAASRYGRGFAGLGLSADLAGFVGRVDAAATWLGDGGATESIVANVDRGFVINELNCYAFLEYYRSGFGRNSIEEQAAHRPLVEALRRGDVFVRETDYLAPGLRIELSPRQQVQTTVIVNAGDGSGLVQPQYIFLYLENLEFTVQGTIPFGGRGEEFGGVPIEINGIESTAAPPNSVTLLVSGYF